MHDLHVADKVFKLAMKEAKENKLKELKKIELELGSVIEHGDEINDSNLVFNIGMLSEGTMANGVKVTVKRVPGNSWKLISISGE